jgi:hypothetical protein
MKTSGITPTLFSPALIHKVCVGRRTRMDYNIIYTQKTPSTIYQSGHARSLLHPLTPLYAFLHTERAGNTNTPPRSDNGDSNYVALAHFYDI